MVGFLNQYENSPVRAHQSSGCDPNDVDTQFNAGEARIYGLETTMNGKVGLRLGLSLIYEAPTHIHWLNLKQDFKAVLPNGVM